MAIRKVGVFGAGQMGLGIVQVCAANGYDVGLAEINQDILNQRMEVLKQSLRDAVSRGRMEQSAMDQILSRVKPAGSLKEFNDCDLVIEAIPEILEAKRKLFAELDTICPPQTIFASNTSSLCIMEMASATKRIDRFVGIHFFNPVPVMKLVELVTTIGVSDDVVKEATSFAQSLGKTPVMTKDTPGFIVNYLLIPYICEAIRLCENGIASKEDIDAGMTLGCGHPMGPLTLADFIGLDTVQHIMESLYDEFRDPKFAPPTLLKRMVLAGQLGRKTGKGFHDYPSKK
jgi:3-hydroxybutyryl-CoA dehydrogenase